MLRIVVALAASAWLFSCATAMAAGNVALVIGNGGYRNVPALPNPPNDANDIAASFERLGFRVKRLTNAGFDDMRHSLIEFGRQARSAEIAVVYFAGHGMEIGGENWLIPVDAELRSDTDAEGEAVSLRFVMGQLSGASKLGLVILDACRNNPFSVKMTRSLRFRAVERGLNRIEPPSDNVAVAYAAKDGTVAGDGDGRNSPFAAALLNNLETPGLDIRFLFASVRDDVMASTRGEQQPFMYQSLSRASIYFKPPVAGAAPPAIITDEVLWSAIRDSTVAALFEDFVRRYPASRHAAEASARLEELTKSQVAVVAPPVAPPPAAPPASGPCGGTVSVSLAARPSCPLSAAEERALKPKDSFKECDTCPEMVVVQSGSFTMGSPASEPGRYDYEGPQHTVTINRQFAVGKFEVTVDQFAAFVKETGYDAGSKCWTFEAGKFDERDGRSWRNPGYPQQGSHPAACLNWDDTNAYVGWLAKQTGKEYRLLREAEWEYAARSTTNPGSGPRYSFGEDENAMCRFGNGADQTAKETVRGTYQWMFFSCNDGYAYTAPVGSFSPNGFGLHDMYGNVWEWIQDCYHDSYKGAPADGSAWTSGGCGRRVLRGGSWYYFPGNLRSASRVGYASDYRRDVNGFRVARTLLIQ
jgi:formylglycine-generating enzyme required for sulfatase activity